MENEITLPSLRDAVATPTPWDGVENFYGNLPEPGWGLLLTRSRDADIATESNWAAAVKELGDSDDVDVIRIGHWAVGWIEFLGVREDTEAYAKAVEIRNALSDYPLLDDEDFYERELEAAIDLWQNVFSPQERINYMRKNRSQFDVETFADLLANARGTTFSGYASELVD